MILANSGCRVYRSVLCVFMLSIIIALAFGAFLQYNRENFCAVTGFTYDDPGDLPDISDTSRASPFYDLNAVRPPSCSYKNYMFPPPMGYGLIDCPKTSLRYRYWDEAMLSHPQTPYIV
jgi:hypothetical protein